MDISGARSLSTGMEVLVWCRLLGLRLAPSFHPFAMALVTSVKNSE